MPADIISSEVEIPRLISEAKQEILITVMTYNPVGHDKSYYSTIDTALRAVAAKNVKVKLMISNWNQLKPAIDHIKSLSLIPNIEVKIVSIPQRKGEFIDFGRVLHSKTMSIDRKIAWIGTSNWAGGYFKADRNLEIVMRDEVMAKRLAQLQEQLWNSIYAEKIDVNKDYPRVVREKKPLEKHEE